MKNQSSPHREQKAIIKEDMVRCLGVLHKFEFFEFKGSDENRICPACLLSTRRREYSGARAR